jgi:hypothetical protein
MKKFIVHLFETPSYKNRELELNADSWYVDKAGALIFATSGGTFTDTKVCAAFGPRAWERVREVQ